MEEFGNVIVRAEADGSFVRLRDVARIELGSQVYDAVSKLDNRPAAMIAVYQSPGANALTVADAGQLRRGRRSTLVTASPSRATG